MTKLKWTGERLLPTVLNETAIEHLARYSFCISIVKDKVVLDAACGEGYGTHLLSGSAKAITAIDIDASVINHARAKYTKSNISFITSSVSSTPFEDHTFDVIISFETLEHLDDHETMLKEFKRLLKPSGLLIISTPNTLVYSLKEHRQNIYHKKEVTPSEFEDLIARFFLKKFLFGQQAFHGSLIHPLASEKFDTLTRYEGDYNQVGEAPVFKSPKYLLAFASDGNLPEERSLLFTGEPLFKQLQRAYESTWSYKIGRTITMPMRFIKNIFG